MESLWLETEETRKFESLNKDIETDVCIIGAGIFGLTSAYYLRKKGLKTVIVDRNEIAHGADGHTTNKKEVMDIKNEIYTNTTIYSIKRENEYYLINADKNTIKAKYVILATHYP